MILVLNSKGYKMKKRTELLFLDKSGDSFIVSILKTKDSQRVFFENEYNHLECLTPNLYMSALIDAMDSGEVFFVTKL